MGQYADVILENRLFRQFDALVSHEDINEAEIAAMKQLVLQATDFVGPHLDRIRETFKQYTEHDLRHVCNIADLIYRFLPKQSSKKEKIRLNGVELTFLWLAILLHDIGMFVSDVEKQETVNSPEYRSFLNHNQDRVAAAQKARELGLELKARFIEDAILAEFYRLVHAERARTYIRQKLNAAIPLKVQDVSLLEDVCDLCESHGWGVRESRDLRKPEQCVARLQTNRRVRYHRVNLCYLACCLRLGDILDFDKSRTPLSVYDEIDFTEEESIKEWNKHLNVDGWQVDEGTVKFDVPCTHPAYFVAVHDFLNWIDEELRECRYLLDDQPSGHGDKYALHLPHAVDRRQVRMSDKKYIAGGFRFHLQYEEIMRLLMDKSLYPDRSLFLRELLQNSLDACRYQKALARETGMSDKYIPRIQVWDCSHDLKDPKIIFQDNGIGMSQRHVESFFLRVGKSFYRSPEFNAERQRLADQGIHLDACSQFGIGFLSCFLGGDLIEVETWRFGNVPLRITITGPRKYFLIERLPEPVGYIPFRSPINEVDDCPPRHTGTRIVVHLNSLFTRSSSSNDNLVFDTIRSFSVNPEFDVVIFKDEERQVVESRGWENSEPLFCNWSTSAEEVATPLLMPSLFDLSHFSPQLRGTGAIWLLKGSDGTPRPNCGMLGIRRIKSSKMGVTVTAELLPWLSDVYGGFQRLKRVGGHSHARDIIEFITSMVDKTTSYRDFYKAAKITFSPHKYPKKIILQIAERLYEILQVLSKDHFATFLKLCEETSGHRKYPVWYKEEAIVKALYNNDFGLLLNIFTDYGIPDFNDCPKLESNYLMSLYGINLPARILDWDPREGYAKVCKILPSTVSARVDVYGLVEPSASRLFAAQEETSKLSLPLGRAVIAHAKSLYLENSSDAAWRTWFRDLLGSSETIGAAVLEEIVSLEDFIEFPCVIDGKLTIVTASQMLQQFGASVTIFEKVPSGKPSGVILNPSIPGNCSWIMKYLPIQVAADGSETADLTLLHNKFGC
jgi:hypothetical protein